MLRVHKTTRVRGFGKAMSSFIHVTPQLTVPSLATALELFRDTLCFEVLFATSNYAYVAREGVAFRLIELPGIIAASPDEARRASYIDVRDVDQLYAELKPKLDRLPAADVEAPRDQHWGQREFAVRGPDGHFIVFGQPSASGQHD